MLGDASRDISIYTGDPSAGRQAQWKARGLVANFLDSDDVSLAKSLKTWKQQISDCHMRLWPGAHVPEISDELLSGATESEGRKKKTEAITVTTTLASAAVLHMFRHQNRDRRLRLKAFELLRAIVERACVPGLSLHILVQDVDDQASWTTQRCNNPKEFTFWSDAFRERHVALHWGWTFLMTRSLG